jgi:hypothetical protein
MVNSLCYFVLSTRFTHEVYMYKSELTNFAELQKVAYGDWIVWFKQIFMVSRLEFFVVGYPFLWLLYVQFLVCISILQIALVALFKKCSRKGHYLWLIVIISYVPVNLKNWYCIQVYPSPVIFSKQSNFDRSAGHMPNSLLVASNLVKHLLAIQNLEWVSKDSFQ